MVRHYLFGAVMGVLFTGVTLATMSLMGVPPEPGRSVTAASAQGEAGEEQVATLTETEAPSEPQAAVPEPAAGVAAQPTAQEGPAPDVAAATEAEPVVEPEPVAEPAPVPQAEPAPVASATDPAGLEDATPEGQGASPPGPAADGSAPEPAPDVAPEPPPARAAGGPAEDAEPVATTEAAAQPAATPEPAEAPAAADVAPAVADAAPLGPDAPAPASEVALPAPEAAQPVDPGQPVAGGPAGVEEDPMPAPEPAPVPVTGPEPDAPAAPAVVEANAGPLEPDTPPGRAEATPGAAPEAGPDEALAAQSVPEALPPADAGTVEMAEAPPVDAAPADVPPVEQPSPEAPAADAMPAPAEAQPEPVDPNLPPVIATDAPEPPRGVADAPQPGFGNNVPGVRINRLPRIGESAAPDTAEAEVSEPVADPATLPAIARNALPFDNPLGLPLFSIVLLDLGEEAGGLDPATLSTLGAPVTVAVDPTREDAADRAAAFRAAGFEIAILGAGLPPGATASDVEVIYQASRAALPEAVAVVSEPGGPIETNRRLTQHIVALLQPDGLGLVTSGEGLNPAAQLAGAAGVPYAEVFRQVDGKGEGSEAVRRTLDRAAFEAVQQGRSVVLATSRPETVTALFAWIAEGEKGVAFAPVSAVALAETAVAANGG